MAWLTRTGRSRALIIDDLRDAADLDGLWPAQLQPAGLAWPTLALAAVLGAHGIPGAVLTCRAACGYVTGLPSMAGRGAVHAALANLARVSLVSIDPASPIRTVRMHPSVRAAVRAYLTQADLEQVIRAAADALIQVWPEPDATAAGQLEELEPQATLRDCAAALGDAIGADGALWRPEVHPLLFRRGSSLEDSGLTESAIAYWQSVVAAGTRLLGPGDETTMMARDRLAAGYEAAGRHGDALAMFQQALAERERGKGAGHPDTIAARGRLAHAFASAGRPAEAIELYEQTVVEAGRRLGPVHAVTLSTRASLAEAYQAAARGKDSIAAFALLADDTERLLGPGHAATRAARAGLAAAYLAAAMLRAGKPRRGRLSIPGAYPASALVRGA
ncbi:MAG: tetratricopeptide repeat protein [Streptosporangiaceae bacterium]